MNVERARGSARAYYTNETLSKPASFVPGRTLQRCGAGGHPLAHRMSAIDNLWLMVGGMLVFFMHSGFALLEVGSVSVRNTQVSSSGRISRIAA